MLGPRVMPLLMAVTCRPWQSLSACLAAQVEASKARQQRIKEQEAEIAALKKQLAGTQHTFGGRTGGRDLDSAVPSEYLCPITQVRCRRVHACPCGKPTSRINRTGVVPCLKILPSEISMILQEIMVDPVIAGDGYTYERCAGILEVRFMLSRIMH